MAQLAVQLNAIASTSEQPLRYDIDIQNQHDSERKRATFDYLSRPAASPAVMSSTITSTDVWSGRQGLFPGDCFSMLRVDGEKVASFVRPADAHDTTGYINLREIATTRIDTDDPKTKLKQPATNAPSRSSPIPQAYHSMLAGAGAGLVSSVVTCPLDVVKTRLQAQSSRKGAADYEGVKDTIQRIWRSAGVRGLYRGLGPTVLGYLPTWGIYFSVYDQIKSSLTPEVPDGTDHWGVHIIAAMTAGATGTIVTNPLWLIRTRFMAQATSADPAERYTNTWIAFRSIYKTEGWRAFYRGLAPSLMGVSHVAVHFPLYEKMKAWAAPEEGGPLNSQRILVCSALSKMVASVITYPHEVLRTRLQIQRRERADVHLLRNGDAIGVSQPGSGLGVDNRSTQTSGRASHGLLKTMSSIAKQDGWKGFYRGISINLIRTVPSSAVTMLTYELIMRRLSS